MRFVLFRNLFSFFMIFALQSLHAQLSKVHYVPPIAAHGAPNSNAYPLDQHIYISTPSMVATTGSLFGLNWSQAPTTIKGGITSANKTNKRTFFFSLIISNMEHFQTNWPFGRKDRNVLLPIVYLQNILLS